MLEKYLVDTCEIITESQNIYGDYEESASVNTACRWRDITIQRTDNNGQVRDADAMVWFAPTASVTHGTVLRYQGILYQVERTTRAKKLGSSSVEFIKTDVKIIQIS